VIIPTLHKEPSALDTVQHRDLRLDTEINAVPLLASFSSFLISMGEFAEASRDFPIVFVKSDSSKKKGEEVVVPMVLFGLRPGENLFLSGDQWDAGYIPALMRSYPFTIAPVENSDKWAMALDKSWKGFSRTKGASLFDDKGKATEFLIKASDFAQQVEVDIDRTRKSCKTLFDKGLLKPMRVDATLANGEKLSVDGFLSVDEEALDKLRDADVVELFRSGLLYILDLHRISLGNVRRLLNRHNARLPKKA
jgi:hypothetical protein